MNLIGKGVALATGIAVVVLSVLDAIEARESIILLGIGLACIALQALSDNE